jgi:hypothetical protein
MPASVQCIASYHSGAFVVGSALGSTITGGVTTCDIPATQAGDFILAFGSDQNANPPVPSADQSKAIRANYAGIGYTYDQTNDVFYAPQPYPSWTISAPTWQWQPPVPYPDDGKIYIWDEATLSWVEVPAPV